MAMSERSSRLVTFGLLLVGLFVSAFAVSQRFFREESSAADIDHGSMGASMNDLGLTDTVDGTRLVIDTSSATELTFHLERDGAPVTEFMAAHGALLHLAAIRSDLSGFQHLHPELAADGTWTTPIDLAQPGQWRVIVDTEPEATMAQVVLGADVVVPGNSADQPLPPPADSVQVDGLTVTRDGLTFAVVPADDLQPYLGQAAHLIAIRDGDLAYAHLHPDDDTLGRVTFGGSLPGAGTYRLFVQVMNGNQVVTAAFTVVQP